MAEYIVSARKYRPARFTEMVGQEQVATTLKNAIRTGHLAHSFLFCGPRGVGKTTAARILAKIINCENIGADFEACGQCNSCTSFQQNSSFNIHELDAASNNSVEDIRSLVEQVRFPPQSGKYKIYIIDEVHMLSQGAFNAFLKTLEEPPAYCKFILATTEKHKILPTILSRCQIFDFRRIGIETIVKHLKGICEVEKTDYEEDALHVIAQKSDGGMRDALSMFDRLANFGGGKLTYASVLENLNVLDYDYFFKVTDALLTENLSSALQLFDTVLKKGFEGDDFILGLCEHFRNLLLCKDKNTLMLLELSDTARQKYSEQASLASPDFLVNCLNLGNQCDVQYKASKNKRLTVELALIKMCYINALVNADDSGKKKLKFEAKRPDESVKPRVEKKEVATEKFEKPAQVTPPKPELQGEPPQKTSTLQEPKVAVVKSKKLLRLDSLSEMDDAEVAKASGTEEEIYTGEIFELNSENINEVWLDYTNKIPETKKGLRISCSTYTPEYNAGVIDIKVQSEIHKVQLEEVQGGLLTFFEQRFGAKLQLNLIFNKEATTALKPYTPKEKFDRIVQKNPAIKKMQQDLGLELDYD
jgi:DNA polymerase-3 subunit gamma/tau